MTGPVEMGTKTRVPLRQESTCRASRAKVGAMRNQRSSLGSASIWWGYLNVGRTRLGSTNTLFCRSEAMNDQHSVESVVGEHNTST